jgi:hypothetical protein
LETHAVDKISTKSRDHHKGAGAAKPQQKKKAFTAETLEAQSERILNSSSRVLCASVVSLPEVCLSCEVSKA